MAKFEITVLASFVGCEFLDSDEMIKPDWMDDEFAHNTMRYTLTKAAMVCARHKNPRTPRPRNLPLRRMR